MRVERGGASDDICLRLEGVLEGDRHADRLAALGAEGAGRGRVTLDLGGAEPDAPATALLVTALRAWREAGAEVVVRGAPQTLAHTLYKLGALRDPGLRLEETRCEEPYAG